MGLPKDLPKELCSVRDAAVAHAATGSALPKNFEALMSWFEVRGEYDHEFLTLDLKQVARHYFDDDEAKARGNFLEDDELTDADRIEVARSIIEHEIKDGDAAFIIGFNMACDNGASAIFFCETHGEGEGGPTYSFAGIYKNVESIKSDYLKSGMLVDPDAATIPGHEILKLWRRPKSKSKK
jgi:hypothetical protein